MGVTRAPWLLVIGLLVALFAVGGLTGKATADARRAAQTAEDSIATLLPALLSSEAAAAAQEVLVAGLSDVLGAERAERATERRELRGRLTVARRDQLTIRDSVLARVDEETQDLLAREVEADSLIHANYERVIEGQAEDVASLKVELGEVTTLAALNRQGWDDERALRIQETLRADAWELVANLSLAERIKDAIPSAGGGVAVGVLLGFVLAG